MTRSQILKVLRSEGLEAGVEVGVVGGGEVGAA